MVDADLRTARRPLGRMSGGFHEHRGDPSAEGPHEQARPLPLLVAVCRRCRRRRWPRQRRRRRRTRRDPRDRLRQGLAAREDPGPRAAVRRGQRPLRQGLPLQRRTGQPRTARPAATGSSATSTRPGTSAPTTTPRCCTRRSCRPADCRGPQRLDGSRHVGARHARPGAPGAHRHPPHAGLPVAARVGAAQPEARADRRRPGQPGRPPGHRRRLRRVQGLPAPVAAVEHAARDPRPRGRLLARRQHLLRRVALRAHPRCGRPEQPAGAHPAVAHLRLPAARRLAQQRRQHALHGRGPVPGRRRRLPRPDRAGRQPGPEAHAQPDRADDQPAHLAQRRHPAERDAVHQATATSTCWRSTSSAPASHIGAGRIIDIKNIKKPFVVVATCGSR